MSGEKSIIISGFRGSGLYPFQFEAVDCNVLKKRKKQKKNNTEPEHSSNVSLAIEFEKSLPNETITEFQTAESAGSWTGNIEKKALFEYWMKINGKSFGTYSQ